MIIKTQQKTVKISATFFFLTGTKNLDIRNMNSSVKLFAKYSSNNFGK